MVNTISTINIANITNITTINVITTIGRLLTYREKQRKSIILTIDIITRQRFVTNKLYRLRFLSFSPSSVGHDVNIRLLLCIITVLFFACCLILYLMETFHEIGAVNLPGKRQVFFRPTFYHLSISSYFLFCATFTRTCRVQCFTYSTWCTHVITHVRHMVQVRYGMNYFIRFL